MPEVIWLLTMWLLETCGAPAACLSSNCHADEVNTMRPKLLVVKLNALNSRVEVPPVQNDVAAHLEPLMVLVVGVGST